MVFKIEEIFNSKCYFELFEVHDDKPNPKSVASAVANSNEFQSEFLFVLTN